MKRSVTRRRVSARRATVPCASVVCNSSSRLSEVEAGFELMTLSWSVRWQTGDGFFVSGTEVAGSGAGDAVTPSRLGCVERVVGEREKGVGALIWFHRCDAGGNRYPHALRERTPVEIGDDRAEPLEGACRLVIRRVGKQQQEFFAAIATETVDVADVGEHGDRECPEHLVAGGMAISVVDALEPVEIDQRDRKGRLEALDAGDLVIQHPHDAAAVERAGQFVEFGELFDTLVGLGKLGAAFVEFLPQRIAIKPDKGALPDRENETQRRGKTLGGGRDRHADGDPRKQEDRSDAQRGESPRDRRLERPHLQRGNCENQKQHVQKSIADLWRGQQKSELDRDMADDLKYGQVVIFETVVEMRFGHDGKNPDQGNPAEEERRWDGHRNRAGMRVNQENGGAERITSDLGRQRLPALPEAARQRLRRRLRI